MKDHISICIATYNRNLMLEHLMRNLALQETGGLFDLSVVVVDNDNRGSARETVIRLREELGIDISYEIEPTRSIPVVRNHALRLARGNYIGIIDDDEFPHTNWLINMYRAISKYEVDGALGPVLPFFTQQPPKWLLKSRLCERPVHRTGILLPWNQTRTGNVLLKKEVFEKHHLSFNEQFKTGGSDQDFFKQAIQAGYRFIAVEEAPVYETVPPERWGKSYYLKRALVNGFNAYKYNMNDMKGFSLLTIPLKSVGALIIYTLSVPFCACIGSHVLVNCLVKGAHHLSRLLAMLGIELIPKRDF
ncbi:MAG: glycosyltransferase family 2 protein [Nitrospira sp.]|nr:glycosyltransferase family 2 protein [Nitrospira sp.]